MKKFLAVAIFFGGFALASCSSAGLRDHGYSAHSYPDRHASSSVFFGYYPSGYYYSHVYPRRYSRPYHYDRPYFYQGRYWQRPPHYGYHRGYRDGYRKAIRPGGKEDRKYRHRDRDRDGPKYSNPRRDRDDRKHVRPPKRDNDWRNGMGNSRLRGRDLRRPGAGGRGHDTRKIQ